MSEDVPVSFLNAVLNVSAVSNELKDQLLDLNRQERRAGGEALWLLDRSILEEKLELIFQEDWELFWSWFRDREEEGPRIHSRFRPKNIFEARRRASHAFTKRVEGQ